MLKKIFRSKVFLITVSIVIVVLAALGITAKILYDNYSDQISQAIDKDTIYDGIFINNVDVSGKTKEEALELVKPLEPSLRENVNINVLVGEQSYPMTTDNVSFNFDTEAVVDQAFMYAKEGSRIERYIKVTNLPENPVNFYISHSIPAENENLQNFVNSVAEQVRVEMKPPHVSEFNPGTQNPFVYHDGIDGVDLNSEKLKTDLITTLQSNVYSCDIAAETVITPFTGTMDDLPSQTVLISSYSTVSTNTPNGNKNMALALASANGSIIEPGETFSFNAHTGNSASTANGYLPASAIGADGSFTDEIGGGICQAATTIYGAALRANMTITSRANHSYPSTYVPVGQDATIGYPYTDFCFRNDSGYSVFIAASMSGTTLSVSIYGYQPPEWDTIEVSSQTTSTIPAPGPQYIEDPSLPAGTQKVKQQAYNGYTAVGQKTFYKNGVVVKTEAIPSSYYKEKGAIILVGAKEEPPESKESSSESSSETPSSETPSSETPSSQAPPPAPPSSEAPSSENTSTETPTPAEPSAVNLEPESLSEAPSE